MTELKNLEHELRRFRARVLVAGFAVLLAFGLLVARLVWLQWVRHDELSMQAESNRTAIVPVVSNRGLILDRNGVVLATNYSAYTLEVTPSKVPDLERTLDELSLLLEITPRDRRRLKKLQGEFKSIESLPIRTRLNDEEVARFAAQRYRFPGVEIKARLFRNYPFGELASHVVGYIGRINQEEKARIEAGEDAPNYRGTDYIGKLGIEQSFEARLHGQSGAELVEQSAGGRAVRRLASQNATPGDSVALSLDIKLQKMIEALYGERRGALVALDPKSGEVLAFVSKPTFDPNLFVDGIDQENWQLLNESLDKPLLNRALRGTYPPGSTYKPFMAMAALQSGKRTAQTVVNDPGFFMFGSHRFRSHGDEGLGAVDLHRSIVKSSNVYYYSLANELGVDAMHDFMKPLGLGQISGIDIPGEVAGLLPSQAWKRNYYKVPEQKKWFPGETISLGIGQGYNSFTMLQMAQAMAALANNGVKHAPRLALATLDAVSGTRNKLSGPSPLDLGYQAAHLDAVMKAMVGVTLEGTAVRAFAGASYLSGGKTGTAQAVGIGQKDRYDARRMEEHQRDHALYIAFAPADDPRIVVAAIVENAGFGSAHAAPLARRVFDYWLLGLYPSEEDIAATRKGESTAPIGKQRRASEIALTPAVPGAPVLSASAPAPLTRR